MSARNCIIFKNELRVYNNDKEYFVYVLGRFPESAKSKMFKKIPIDDRIVHKNVFRKKISLKLNYYTITNIRNFEENI